MALTNNRGAWVNRSSTNIPVYSSTVHSNTHRGGVTAGGTQIGYIAPNEFYTLFPSGVNFVPTFYQIAFNIGSSRVLGYIETNPGITLPDHSWVAYQEPYHFYNSNGSTLVPSLSVNIGGVNYRRFTLVQPAHAVNRYGTSIGTLPTGTSLLTNTSTTGQNYYNYMLFQKKYIRNAWVNLDSSGGSYGFVNLGIESGALPNNRTIR